MYGRRRIGRRCNRQMSCSAQSIRGEKGSRGREYYSFQYFDLCGVALMGQYARDERRSRSDRTFVKAVRLSLEVCLNCENTALGLQRGLPFFVILYTACLVC